jgi:hypothetical protein
MSFRIVPACSRCGARKAVAMVSKSDKRVGYCRKCAAYLVGIIPEDEAPRLRQGLFSRSGWVTREEQKGRAQ